jgi:hypothetical protein
VKYGDHQEKEQLAELREVGFGDVEGIPKD